jgi:uncharacterized protein YhfF
MSGVRLAPFELGTPGPMRDRLVAAVLRGEKTATSSLLAQYQEDGERLPRPGDRLVMVASDEQPVAVVEIIEVTVIALGDASLQLALDEGEGFRSVAQWRSAHERFWINEVKPELEDPEALVVGDETEVVVERFCVLEGEPC